jgi:hypothetical protein
MSAAHKTSYTPLIILEVVIIVAVIALLALGNYSSQARAHLITRYDNCLASDGTLSRDVTQSICWREGLPVCAATGDEARCQAQLHVYCTNLPTPQGGCRAIAAPPRSP